MSVTIVVADIAADRRRFIDDTRALKTARIVEATASEYRHVKLAESGMLPYVLCIDIMSTAALGIILGYCVRPRGFFARYVKPSIPVAFAGPYFTMHQSQIHEQEHHRLLREGKQDVVLHHFIDRHRGPFVIAPLPLQTPTEQTLRSVERICADQGRNLRVLHLARPGVGSLADYILLSPGYKRVEVTDSTVGLLRALD